MRCLSMQTLYPEIPGYTPGAVNKKVMYNKVYIISFRFIVGIINNNNNSISKYAYRSAYS